MTAHTDETAWQVAFRGSYLVHVNLMVSVAIMGFILGCGPRGLSNMVPLRGTVTLDGQPLTQGKVLYLPAASGGRRASGEIQTDGTFAMTTLHEGDGVQAGDYQIVVIAYVPFAGEPTREQIEAAGGALERKSAIPERYTRGETSGLTDHVDAEHPGVKHLELSSH